MEKEQTIPLPLFLNNYQGRLNYPSLIRCGMQGWIHRNDVGAVAYYYTTQKYIKSIFITIPKHENIVKEAFFAVVYLYNAKTNIWDLARVRTFQKRWKAKDTAFKWYCRQSEIQFKSLHKVSQKQIENGKRLQKVLQKTMSKNFNLEVISNKEYIKVEI